MPTETGDVGKQCQYDASFYSNITAQASNGQKVCTLISIADSSCLSFTVNAPLHFPADLIKLIHFITLKEQFFPPDSLLKVLQNHQSPSKSHFSSLMNIKLRV